MLNKPFTSVAQQNRSLSYMRMRQHQQKFDHHSTTASLTELYDSLMTLNKPWTNKTQQHHSLRYTILQRHWTSLGLPKHNSITHWDIWYCNDIEQALDYQNTTASFTELYDSLDTEQALDYQNTTASLTELYDSSMTVNKPLTTKTQQLHSLNYMTT